MHITDSPAMILMNARGQQIALQDEEKVASIDAIKAMPEEDRTEGEEEELQEWRK